MMVNDKHMKFVAEKSLENSEPVPRNQLTVLEF